jgi:hypothetical protein
MNEAVIYVVYLALLGIGAVAVCVETLQDRQTRRRGSPSTRRDG